MKTDAQLQQDVMTELQWDPALHAAEIGVQVHDGAVTLTGEVSSFLEKLHAETAAQRVAGLRALVTEITVKLSAFGRRTDADIAGSAVHALHWTEGLPPEAVQVLVENGWIVLTGTVAWQYQREAAAESVRHLWGVVGLSNQIVIEPAHAADASKAGIEAALRRRAPAQLRRLKVEVIGDDVILSGSVPTWADRDLATHAAWSSPGVRRVTNHIAIA
jgi:osmotically-inducible protein OsmY